MLLIIASALSIVILAGVSVWGLIRGSALGLLGIVAMGTTVALSFWFNRDLFRDIGEALQEGGNYLKGAHGEVLVHQALAALPDEYIVFNDFHPMDANGKPAVWNVDHIVVGPTGVFVLDAKYYKNPRVLCAEKSSFNRKNVVQVQRNSMELKDKLVRWSAGALEKLFVVPVVVYAQPEASLERLREGAARTLPLRLLTHEILSHAEGSIDQERAGRVARVLYSQIGRDLQASFKDVFDAYGQLSKAARYDARDTRLAAAATARSEPEAKAVPPEVCPLCGGKLLRRTARHGTRAGKPFLGCENYAKNDCRYGFNLEE